MPSRCAHCLLGCLRRRGRQGGEDAAGVEAADAELPEEVLPVHVPRPQRCDSRVTPIGHAERTADAEPALGEVQAIARRVPDAVVGRPTDEPSIDAALQDEVLDQAPDVVVAEGRGDRGAQAEAAVQASGDVVLAAALPHTKRARGVDPLLARVEAQHDLTQGHDVEGAVIGSA